MLGEITALSHDQLAALYVQREREIAEEQIALEQRHQQELATREAAIARRDQQLVEHEQLIAQHVQVIAEHEHVIAEKQFQIEQLQRMLFGSRRERFTVPEGQTTLPFLTDLESVTRTVANEIATVAAHTRRATKKHPGRLPLPAHLPVEEVDLIPEGVVSGMKCIGSERFDELMREPERFWIKRYIRWKYVTPEDSDIRQHVLIAPMPQRWKDKCEASAELITTIITDKHVSHLPVYRQLERYKALGVEISRSTADNWQRHAGLLLRPLHAALKALVLQAGYLQVDESGIAVQDRAKKGKTHRGFMWAYHAPLNKLIYFDYQRGRGAINCKQMLEEFRGYLQTDGYAAYKLHKARDEVTPLACWAHVRRKFFDAQSNDETRSTTMLALIRKLYDVERFARENALSADERKEVRLERSLPLTNAISAWLVCALDETKPQSPIGKAIRYTISLWNELENYLHDGSLEIDNNLVENAIRPLALGRKNYLFAGSHDGAVNIAMYRSFFATCRLNDIDPYRWLLYVLETIRKTDASQYYMLLPQNIDKTLLVTSNSQPTTKD